MSSTLHRFLQQFLRAYRNQDRYVVVGRSKATLQCAAIFLRWGLISYCTDLSGGGLPTGGPLAPTGGPPHLVLVFHPWPTNPALANEQRGTVAGRPPHVPSARGPHRLELVYSPTGRGRRLHRSHRWLRGRMAHFNCLYLLSTSRGIVTSDEALRFRLGGILLLILHL
jgi:hypothetical protein